MRFLIVGAGAVGATLGVSLEHQKHEVTYVVRPGRKASLSKLFLVDAATGKPWKRERPNVVELGGRLPPFEACLLCVRGDQVDEALAAVAPLLRADARIGIVAPTVSTLAQMRARHPGHAFFRILPAYSAWQAEPNVFHFLKPPIVKTVVTGEGDADGEAAAAEFAPLLDAAGFPAKAVPSAHERLEPAIAPAYALLAGWELAGWDVEALADDKRLRGLVADAMGEIGRLERAKAHGAAAFFGTRVPGFAYAVAMRALPRLAGANTRTMWRLHGPKIAAQTRQLLDDILRRAGDRDGVSRLRELRARLPEIVPPPPPPPPVETRPARKAAPKKPVVEPVAEEEEENV